MSLNSPTSISDQSLPDSFQRVLLDLSTATAQSESFQELILLFCQTAQEVLQVSGVYYWHLTNSNELAGLGGHGPNLETFLGLRLGLAESAVVTRAISARKTIYVNDITSETSSIASKFKCKSVMVAPLVVAGEIMGALTFTQNESANFTSDIAAKATILATMLGGVMAANARARELDQLLEITSELGSTAHIDEFLQKITLRAADFLGFRRAFIAVTEGDQTTARWMAENRAVHPLRITIPGSFINLFLPKQEAFWTDDITQLPQVDQGAVQKLRLRQYLAVPLLDSAKRLIGFLAVLDRLDGAGISPEDVRRSKVLASEVAVVLEATNTLDVSEQNRKRAENLISLALELNSSLRLPQFIRSFTQRAADMLGARAAVLALAQRSTLETVVLHDTGNAPDKNLIRRLNASLTDLAIQSQDAVTTASASQLLGEEVAFDLGWHQLTVTRLHGGDGELIGMLCLVDREQPLSESDQTMLTALAAHAAVALENARLFTRMDQANRHWVEIFDAITDFIVVHDETNQVLRVNRSLADFIGTRPAELIGISMRALVAMASDTNSQPCPFCRVGLDGADEYIHPVLERTYLVSTSRIHGAANEGFQTIHVLKDITDRREAERRYRELFDTIQEGLFFSTPEGRFIEVNDALVRILGYESRDELLQVDIPRKIYLNPDLRKRFAQEIERHGTLRNYEETLRRKDGSPIHTLQNAFAVRDSQGRIVQYRGLILDITEQKNFHFELERQRDFNNKILNATQSMILVLDVEGLVSYGNRRCFEAGGYKQQDLLGHKLSDLIPPGRREVFLEALLATLRGHQVDNLELPLVLGRGRVGQFGVNLSPMRDENGQVTSIVVVMTDITDAAMLQAKLIHTEKMAAVGQLVSGVAHEVNNPLTAILGFADLLLEHPNMPEFAKADLNVILHEAQRTKQIVQNLLSFARQMPPQRKPVPVNSILRQTLALRSYDIANHGVKVIEQLAENIPDIVGDSHQLQQVFLNILNNAYDAVNDSSGPGQILIQTTYEGGIAEISFRDNGNGVLYPERIFDPFFTTKELGKGTGLGLSICYGIVREHGGEIFCRNNKDGPGATFVVRLPLATPAIRVLRPVSVTQ